MKYKLKEHVTDEMLEAIGFDTTYGHGCERNGVYICKIKMGYKWYYQVGAISFDDINRDYDTDITPYIQDLIDLNYVEVVE